LTILSCCLLGSDLPARTKRARLAALLGAFGLVLASVPAVAFPPYRTTDADTAGAQTLELRLGLVKLQRRDSASERSAPLSRLNFGVGRHYEVISELEYAIDDHRFAEGALGFKWANLTAGRGVGVETLILLPVHSELGGAGIESQYLRTWQHERWQLHVNAGGFYDPRSTTTERGWRASMLVEFPRDRLRPGIELFVKDARSDPARVQAGVGVIAPLERFEIRAGLHVGLNDAAPDVEATVWFSWKWRLARDAP
jgi:hypothetical protein